MTEYVRSMKVSVEVDTNKQTYRLDIDDADSVDEVANRVSEFLESLGVTP